MMFHKILVPYDGSDHAKSALAYAKGLIGDDPDAQIIVAHAVPSGVMGLDRLGTDGALDGVPIGMIDLEQYEGVVKHALDAAREKVVAHVGDQVAELGDRARIEVVAGSAPADALAKYAEKNGCDLIVMGRRGVGAIRGMLGSVSFGVLRASDIPVLTVK